MPIVFCKNGIPVPEIEIEKDKKEAPITAEGWLEEVPLFLQNGRRRNTTIYANEEGMRLFEEALQRERQNPAGRWILHEELQRQQQFDNQRTLEMIWGTGTSANPYLYTFSSPRGHMTTLTTDGLIAPSTTTSVNQYSSRTANIDNGL